MAMCDYYLCDVCGQKCFYDANMDFGSRLGDMAAICTDCATTHRVVVQKIEPPVTDTPQGWQPIETAPRDGTEVLLSDGRFTDVGAWNRGGAFFAPHWMTCGQAHRHREWPTLWHPMPKLPTVPPQEGQ